MSDGELKTAVVTGCNGQDGRYMSRLLLSRGYRVVGCARHPEAASRSGQVENGVELVAWDPCDQQRLAQILLEYRPAELYNFAAYSSGTGMYDDPIRMGEVNGLAVARLLEAIRSTLPEVRFCQASSSEMFGTPPVSPQNETTPFNPRSPYGAAKVFGHSMIGIYRRRYGTFACSAILFNHESPYRTPAFVTRKITRTAVEIKLGRQTDLRLGDLEARRDWGFAGDVVQAMWKMLQMPQAEDYVIATGQTHSVRELCQIAFAHLGLNYLEHVVLDPSYVRPPESIQLVGDPHKALSQLEWQPTLSFGQLVCAMVDADLNELQNGAVY